MSSTGVVQPEPDFSIPEDEEWILEEDWFSPSKKPESVLPAILSIGLRVDDDDRVVLDDDIDYVVLDDYADLEKLIEIVLEDETRVLADSKTVTEIFNLEFKQKLIKKVQFQLNQFGLELKTSFQITSEIDAVNKIVLKELQNPTAAAAAAEVKNTVIEKVNTFWYLPPLFKNNNIGLLRTAEEDDWFLCQFIHKYDEEEKIALSRLEKLLAHSPYIIEKQAEASFYEIQKQIQASLNVDLLTSSYVAMRNYLQNSMGGIFQEVAKMKPE